MEIKICTKCKKEYPATKEFFYKGKGKFGLCYWCKRCYKEWQQSDQNKESHRKASREYYQRNRKRVIKYNGKWCRENKESCKKSCKKWYENNKKQISIMSAEWYKNNGKQYYQDNKKRINNTCKKWKGSNKDKISDINARRRARMLNRISLLTVEEEEHIQEIYTICAFMNSNSINIKWHVDHIMPLSKGGIHHSDNLQILEAGANLRKGAKLLNEL